ncbi:MAG TPA: hypothetical protein VE422_01620 [Terriglobia bacterium]|nr:hypothetical protein [Terriglobia bacterium]
MRRLLFLFSAFTLVFLAATVSSMSGQEKDNDNDKDKGNSVGNRQDGKRLFERETFGGNGRTCRTCHSSETGTVSPQDALKRFQENRRDPLFIHDGSDDGLGHGITRMLTDATILMQLPLPRNVRLAGSNARSVILRRGIPTTINTPGLDPVLMLDGRQPTLQAQAAGAIHDHAQSPITPTAKDLDRIAEFQVTDAFFSSEALENFFRSGINPRLAPGLPRGRTASEKRGRRFFEDLAPDATGKDGLCSACHSGPLLNTSNQFSEVFGVPRGTRFQTVLVSELNEAGNQLKDFIITRPDRSEFHVVTPDPGRALITGIWENDLTFSNVNAFKISPLRNVRNTAPYFHDNSAKTLEQVVTHYAQFFAIVTGGFIQLTPQDQEDIVAFMELL